ncbi:MAG: AMP-binding protein [Candidatus Tectomicrobia bacterium]|uniref:AMP-binding protein n=1 Tax=Tectimicrobiota bacterium TaxID=2528274 RepID=A0A932M0K5_UNCTE|nr:AMP-binding protein [Candidatus Tectomicrobia bacterium]
MNPILRPSLKPYPEISLPEVLSRSAKHFGDKIAAVHGSQTATFSQLNAQCAGIAAGLARSGVEPGQRVALMGQNSIDYIAAFFGILKAGGVVVPFSPAYAAREIAAQLVDCEAAAAIVDSDLLARFTEAGGSLIPAEKRISIGKPEEDRGPCLENLGISPGTGVSFPPLAPDRLAVIAYSSGTTGVPKGVMLTHRNLVTNLVQFQYQDPMPITPADTFLNHLPFFHIYGMNVLMAEAVAVGATQVIMSRYDPEELVDLIARHRATLLFTVPPVLLSLVHFPRIQDRDLSSLRYVNSGAAPLPAEVAREFRALTGVPVKQGYGLTETSPAINTDFYAHAEIESVGPPLADTEERVLDLRGPRRVLGPGEVGELVVRGPQVMRGYWRDPGLTSRVLVDGWFHTGDLARMDERGYVFIVGRTKEMIKYKGYTVAPAELEALLLEHPLVQDCAVIGVADQEAGEIPKAFVVLKPGQAVSGDVLMEFLRGKVAGYKRVRQVEFVDAVPRSPSGKILRHLLASKAAPGSVLKGG